MRALRIAALGWLSWLAVLAGGCALPRGVAQRSLPTLISSSAPVSAPASASSTVPESELPMDQTVALCLATAERLAGEGHAREASLLYLKARKLAPNATDYSRRLAPLFAQLQDLPRAQEEYTAALAGSPRDADLWNDWGCLLLRRGDYAAAEQKLRQALAVAPGHTRARTNLALVCAHVDRREEAWDLFASVVGPAAAHSNLGVVLAGEGRTAEARREFERALQLDPDLPLPALFLEQLDRLAEATPPPGNSAFSIR